MEKPTHEQLEELKRLSREARVSDWSEIVRSKEEAEMRIRDLKEKSRMEWEITDGMNMPDDPINGREPNFSEDDIQRDQLGPRGVPGKQDPAKMTPQREKKTPKNIDPDHPA
jgi:hypothetical protein